MTVAALYVAQGGAYSGLPGVDPWDEVRDARSYSGPHPVVAHPPCARWCRLAGFVESRWGHKRGDDGGTFAAALAAVEQWGGVLEHPAWSAAWPAFGLPVPMTGGGWCGSFDRPGWSCHVEQGRYGHPVKKATWLYAVGVDHLPDLRWGSVPDQLSDSGTFWTHGRTRVGKAAAATPQEFRDVLLAMARSVEPDQQAKIKGGAPPPTGREDTLVSSRSRSAGRPGGG